MTRTPAYYTDAALAAFNAGFSSKAAQKGALADLNRAYSMLRETVRKVELSNAPHNGKFDLTPSDWDARTAYFNANETPFDLHLVRLVHAERFDRFVPGTSTAIAELVDLRAAIKAAPVTPPAKDETKVRAVRVVETIKALMARRQVQYLTAIDLSEVFGDGIIIHGLSANSHYVTNEHGTTFLRTFYYLNGALTPLNTILAGAQEAGRRAELVS